MTANYAGIKTTCGVTLLSTEIQWFSRRCLVVCDQQCQKAWGFDRRPGERRSDPDDRIWYSDDEIIDPAPDDPGSYEGGQGKPFRPSRHNKWCVRACERSNMIEIGKPIHCDDWSHRHYNQPWKHGLTTNPHLETGLIYQPDPAP